MHLGNKLPGIFCSRCEFAFRSRTCAVAMSRLRPSVAKTSESKPPNTLRSRSVFPMTDTELSLCTTEVLNQSARIDSPFGATLQGSFLSFVHRTLREER